MSFLDKRNSDEELSQAKARLVFAMVSPLYIWIVYLLYDTEVAERPIYVFGVFVLIFAYSFSLRLWLQKPRDFLPARQWMSVVHDLGGISLIMYETGQWGAALYPLYLWVISGNTMRFGLSFFWGAVGIGLLGFSLVIFQNPYWLANRPLGVSLLISIIVLPSFFAVLLKRLHYLKDKLHEEFLRAEYEASHDPLTKLPNRAQFEDRLRAELKRSQRHQLVFSILFIDLDGFKKINDRLGHRAGDLLLQQTADRMQAIIRTTDLLARLGGDEFALITASATENDKVINLLERLHEINAQPYTINNYLLEVSASIGVAYYPLDGVDAEALMGVADIRMYQQKNSSVKSA